MQRFCYTIDLTFQLKFNFKASYIYSVFQHQACVYRTQAQYDRSHALLTLMIQTEAAKSILSVECISAVEKFQVVMKKKQKYVAHQVRLGVSLTCHAATTSPVESMNSNIKGSMGCSSNTYTSTSLLKMARGSNRRITNFVNEAQRELHMTSLASKLVIKDTILNEAQRALQMTSLASKLVIKDTILKECLHICNHNFDNRKYQHCVQCSEDDWMVLNFYHDKSKIIDNIAGMVPKFLNVYHVRLKNILNIPFLRCDCLFYNR